MFCSPEWTGEWRVTRRWSEARTSEVHREHLEKKKLKLQIFSIAVECLRNLDLTLVRGHRNMWHSREPGGSPNYHLDCFGLFNSDFNVSGSKIPTCSEQHLWAHLGKVSHNWLDPETKLPCQVKFVQNPDTVMQVIFNRISSPKTGTKNSHTVKGIDSIWLEIVRNFAKVCQTG